MKPKHLNIFVFGVLFTLGIFFPSLAFSKENSYNFARFGTYFTAYFQPDSATSRSGLLLWSPAHRLNDRITLITDIGATYLNTPDSKYFAIYLSPRFDFALSSSLSADFSVGTQNWTIEGGFLPMAGVGVNYHIENDLLPFMKTIRLAGNRIWKTDFPTWQVLVGVEFSLGGSEKPVEEKKTVESIKPVKEVKQKPAAVPELEATNEGLKLTLSSNHISFAFGKSDIPEVAAKYLSAIGKAFADFNEQWSEITISGHTDNKGNARLNKQLSLDRAKSVASLFKRQGVDARKVVVSGEGSAKPVDTNESIEGRKHNRRVEIAIKAGSATSPEMKTRLEEINKTFSKESKP